MGRVPEPVEHEPCCIPPVGMGAPAPANVYPATWHALGSRPGSRIGSWGRHLQRCERCGTIWYVLHDPRDDRYDGGVPLPPGFEPVLREDATLDEIWPWLSTREWGALVAGHEHVPEDLLDRYFAEARYPAAEAVERMVADLAKPDLTPAEAARLLRALRAVVVAAGAAEDRHAADGSGGSMTVREPGPLLAILDRDDLYRGTPGEREWQRAEVRRRLSAFVEAAFGTARGARRDVIAVEPGLRRRLLDLARLEDRTVAPPGAAYDRRIAELRARRAERAGAPAARERAAPGSAFADVLSTTARRLRDGWRYFVPAVVVTYVLVEIVPRGVPVGMRSEVAGMFLILNLTWYAAAASKCAGRWRRNLFRLVLSRVSVSMTYLLVVVVWGVLILLGLFAAGLTGAMDDAARTSVAAALAGVLALPLAIRLWPVLAVPFLYPGYGRWSVAAGAAVWVGPGIGTAWRMTGRSGVFTSLTLPLLLVLGSTALLFHWAPRTLLAHALYYGGFLPLATTAIDVAAERIRVATAYDRLPEE